MVKLLLKSGASAKKPNKIRLGRTPLWKAISTGNQELFNLIMEHVVTVRITDDQKLTPLHFAAGVNHPKMVKALLKKSARINALQENGATPLMYAVSKRASKGVRALLEAGADRKIADRNGITPISAAEHFKDEVMIGMLYNLHKK